MVKGHGAIKRQPTEEIVQPAKADTLTPSTVRKATNLPPADILFDHIDRVSTKIEKVRRTNNFDNESVHDGDLSVISKASFRSKKRVPAFRQSSLEEEVSMDNSSDHDLCETMSAVSRKRK